MRPHIRARALGRLAAILAATGALLLVGAAPALAAVPPNDDISNATVITSLPFHGVLDISQATSDPATDIACVGQPQTVWYEFTPASSESVAFDPSSSNQIMNIAVFTGSPAALSFIGCGQGGPDFNGGFILDATGGTTYWIMASPICCVQTPTLDLSVYLAVAPHATLSVTGGTVDRAGNAAITGTFDCVGTVPGGVSLAGTITQPVGRLKSVTASFATATPTPCGPAQPWTALAQPGTGKFAGGAATVNVAPPFSVLCNIAGCTTLSATAVIKLKG